NGSVNALSADTTVTFDYSTSANLSSGTSTTAAQDIGSASVSVPVTARLTGLTPSTTYYFQVVASNSGGTSRGEILSFTTATAPILPFAVTGIASPDSDVATVSGTVNPEGNGTDVTFQYSTDQSLPQTYATHFAGFSGTRGSADGSGTSTLLAGPSGVA